MSDSEYEYLSAKFDPSKVTADRLRGILVSHDVRYPSSAKKAQLIELFNTHVVPQARQILKEQRRVKRTSRGIEDIESSQTSSFTGEAEPTLAPAMEKTPRKRSRKSTAPSREVDGTPDEDVKPEVSPKKRSSSTKAKRASSSKRTVGSEDTEPKTVERKKSTRKSEVKPALKVEEPSDLIWSRGRTNASAFSSENPFQSGSSPPSGDSKETRRKSSGIKAEKPRKSTSDEQTEALGKQKRETRTRKIEVPSRRGRKQSVEDASDSTLEAGEEFAPEEEEELDREEAMNGKQVHPARKHKKSSSSGRISRSAPWVVILTLLSGYATWWRREKVAVGYCGVGSSTIDFGEHNIPDWAKILQPQCELCPSHAYCSTDLDTQCEKDFVLQPHPLSFGGLIPLAPSCEPDGEKARKVKAVADRTVEELRDRRAKYECGELNTEKGASKPHVEISETKLREVVGEKRRKGMSQEEFEDLWRSALGEVLDKDEITAGTETHSSGLHLSSKSLARVRFGCAVRRSARLTLARYRIQLGSIGTVTLLIVLIIRHLRASSDAKARVPDLVGLTLDRLSTQATLHAQDPRGVPEPWISAGQLRDDVLRDEFSPARREHLWRRVRAVVETNANVRANVRETRGGEVSRVWEWIGPVSVGDKRKSLPDGLSSPPPPLRSPSTEDTLHEMTQRSSTLPRVKSKWNEGRPIY